MPRKPKYSRKNVQVLSYGGGLQSIAICVLIKEGLLPVPDLAGIADTAMEAKSTWENLGPVQKYLEPTGLQIQVISHELSRVGIYADDSDLGVLAS